MRVGTRQGERVCLGGAGEWRQAVGLGSGVCMGGSNTSEVQKLAGLTFGAGLKFGVKIRETTQHDAATALFFRCGVPLVPKHCIWRGERNKYTNITP